MANAFPFRSHLVRSSDTYSECVVSQWHGKTYHFYSLSGMLFASGVVPIVLVVVVTCVACLRRLRIRLRRRRRRAIHLWKRFWRHALRQQRRYHRARPGRHRHSFEGVVWDRSLVLFVLVVFRLVFGGGGGCGVSGMLFASSVVFIMLVVLTCVASLITAGGVARLLVRFLAVAAGSDDDLAAGV